jgi:hypothetical protein
MSVNLSFSAKTFRPLCFLALGLLLLGSAQAQEADDSAADAAPATNAPPSEAQRAAGEMEEVIVRGQRSLGSLIREGAELTEDFYSRLNEVIDDDDFRINCWNEFPTGSRISTRVCRMRFQEELLNRQSVSLMRTVETTEDGFITQNGAVFDAQPEMIRMMLEFEQELVQAVNVDPVLNAQVIRLIALKAAVENYESPRAQQRRERRAEAEAFEDSDDD